MIWTSGVWTVKVGREDEFISAWAELAVWTKGAFPANQAWLLRQREHPEIFMSVGPWPSDQAIEEWRASEGLRDRLARLRELVVTFEPRTFDQVVEAA
jgi:heme-degrading monooxygenase HmoA